MNLAPHEFTEEVPFRGRHLIEVFLSKNAHVIVFGLARYGQITNGARFDPPSVAHL